MSAPGVTRNSSSFPTRLPMISTLENALYAGVQNIQIPFAGLASDLTADTLNTIATAGASKGIHTIVVWQVDVDPSLVALAETLGLQIFTSDDLSTLVNDVQQSVLNAPAGVLANDNALNGQPLTAQLDTLPANGSLTLNPDGSFTYTPDPGFIGTDTFTYSASDGIATSAPTTVTITVHSFPVANPDQYATTMNQTLNVSAWGNDCIVIISDTPADDSILAGTIMEGMPNVQIIFQGLGSDLTADNLNYIASAGASLGVHTIVVWQVAVSPDLLSLAQTLGLQIFTSDDLSTLVNDVEQSTSNTPAGVLANDTNADGLPLTAQLVDGARNGSVTLNPDGSFSYTPNAGFYGIDAFNYVATDAYASSLPATVLIAVYSIPVANPDAYSDIQDQLLSVDAADGVLANDESASGDPVLSTHVVTSPAKGLLRMNPGLASHLEALLVTPPVEGTLQLNADGSFDYMPNPGFSGTDSFTYEAEERAGLVRRPRCSSPSTPSRSPTRMPTPSRWGKP